MSRDSMQLDQDLDDLNMLRYFHQEKGDMTRYCRYEECIARFPLIRHARDNLELAEIAMGAAFDRQEVHIQ